MKHPRTISFLIIILIYVAATALGIIVYDLDLCKGAFCWNLFLADVAATVFVWAWGLYFKNVSVYDPYWSVAPPVIMTACAVMQGGLSCPAVLALAAVWIWALRLTFNWAVTFHGLAFEDWRYSKFRVEQPAFIFQIINFFGLNMMPTVVVFLCLLPGIALTGGPEMKANALTWIAFVISVGAASIQLISDTQAHIFRREHRGEVCRVGLWKKGRHPNYFGEIMMWWGIWLMYVSVVGFSEKVWYIVGPVAMTCMFRFISVPLMEGRQLANKPDYAAYKSTTRMFI